MSPGAPVVCVGCGTGFLQEDPDQARCARCIFALMDAAGQLPTAVAVTALEQAAKTPGWHTAATPAQMVRILNEALLADPVAVESLVRQAVECNDAMRVHSTILVKSLPDSPGKGYLTFLGLLNGVFGLRENRGAIGKKHKGPETAPIASFVLMEDELGARS